MKRDWTFSLIKEPQFLAILSSKKKSFIEIKKKTRNFTKLHNPR